MAPRRQFGLRPEVAAKLDGTVEWIRDRDPWLGRRLDELRYAPSRRVSVFGSDEPGRLRVNPRAVRDLTVKELAGDLAAALLGSAALADATRARREVLRVRVLSLRERVRNEAP